MKLNDYGSPKAVPSLKEHLSQESDGRHVKPKQAKVRRKKGERNPARIAQEQVQRAQVAYKQDCEKRATKGLAPRAWHNFIQTTAYERARKGES